MNKLFLGTIILLLSANVFAMSEENLVTCMEDATTNSKRLYQLNQKSNIRISKYLGMAALSLDEKLAEKIYSDEVQNCVDFNEFLTERTKAMDKASDSMDVLFN